VMSAQARDQNADVQAGAAYRIGITGHVHLTSATLRLVAQDLRRHLAEALKTERVSHAALVGVSCLAPGADSVFARILLRLGGRLEVILPSADYRDATLEARRRQEFDSLLRRAADVRIIPFERAEPRAFAEANEEMLARVRRLVAVWDGRPEGPVGGTAHAVKAAQERDIPVTVIWPEGAFRR
jgi:hypothetical protein